MAEYNNWTIAEARDKLRYRPCALPTSFFLRPTTPASLLQAVLPVSAEGGAATHLKRPETGSSSSFACFAQGFGDESTQGLADRDRSNHSVFLFRSKELGPCEVGGELVWGGPPR